MSLYDQFISNRMITKESLEQLNNPDHPTLYGTWLFNNLLYQIRAAKGHVVILPDFDMDGIMAGSLGCAGLRALEFNCDLYHPDPRNGYGFTPNDIDKILKQFPDVTTIITCDVGITCFDGIDYAAARGIEVIVTDHHVELTNHVPVNAVVRIDPSSRLDTYPNKSICGAHVLWQLITSFDKLYGNQASHDAISWLRICAGIATMSDSMAMIKENRKLVKEMLQGLNILTTRLPQIEPNVQRLLRGFQLFTKRVPSASGTIDQTYLSFNLIPTFNAVKRMGDSSDDAFLVFFGEEQEQIDAINRLIDLNEKKKLAVSQYMTDLTVTIQPLAPYIYFTDAPMGICGLLATNLNKQSGVTTLVINNDELSGSGRSPLNAIDLWSKDFPIAGHQHAFGVDFASRKQAQEMYQAIKEATASTPVSIRASQVDVHAESNTPLTEIEDFLDRIQKFAPFGPGFPLPRVSITFDPSDANFKLLSAGKHLKATLPNGVDVLLWNLGEKLTDFIQAEHVSLIGTFGYNYFKDKKTVQFNVDKIFFE